MRYNSFIQDGLIIRNKGYDKPAFLLAKPSSPNKIHKIFVERQKGGTPSAILVPFVLKESQIWLFTSLLSCYCVYVFYIWTIKQFKPINEFVFAINRILWPTWMKFLNVCPLPAHSNTLLIFNFYCLSKKWVR